MLSCTNSDTLTRGKYQRVPQILDNKKKLTDFGKGLSIASLTLFCRQQEKDAAGLDLSLHPETGALSKR